MNVDVQAAFDAVDDAALIGTLSLYAFSISSQAASVAPSGERD